MCFLVLVSVSPYHKRRVGSFFSCITMFRLFKCMSVGGRRTVKMIICKVRFHKEYFSKTASFIHFLKKKKILFSVSEVLFLKALNFVFKAR